MADKSQAHVDLNTDATKDGKKSLDAVSLARRRALTIGLASPLILTLRSKPLFAQAICTAATMLSATHTSHSPACIPPPTQQDTTGTTGSSSTSTP